MGIREIGGRSEKTMQSGFPLKEQKPSPPALFTGSQRRETMGKGPASVYEAFGKERRIDVVGGDADDRATMLIESLLPAIQENPNHLVFIVDLSGEKVSKLLREATAKQGWGMGEWQASPSMMLQASTASQYVDMVTSSMASDPHEKKPDRRVERDVLRRIFNATGERGVNPDDGSGISIPPTLEQVNHALIGLTGTPYDPNDVTNTLTREQYVKVQRQFPDTYKNTIDNELIQLQSHVSDLVASDFHEEPVPTNDARTQLVVFEIPAEVHAKTALQDLLIGFITNTVETRRPISKPDTLVVTKAETLAPQTREALDEACRDNHVKLVYMFDKVDEELVEDIGYGAALAIMKMPNNARVANRLSELVGEELGQRMTGRSSSTSVSVNKDSGRTKNRDYNSLGIPKIRPASKSKSTSTSRSSTFGHDESFGIDFQRTLSASEIARLKQGEMWFSDSSGKINLVRPALPQSKPEASSGPRQYSVRHFDEREQERKLVVDSIAGGIDKVSKFIKEKTQRGEITAGTQPSEVIQSEEQPIEQPQELPLEQPQMPPKEELKHRELDE